MPTAVIAGYGPGIAHALALKYASHGYQLALLSRTASKLEAAATTLRAQNLVVNTYPVDLTDHAAVTATIAKIRAAQGPIGLVHWHPMGPFLPFFGTDPAAFARELALPVSFVAAVQAAKDDLVATKGSVLVTGGGTGPEAEASVKVAIAFGAATAAIGKAATRKAMFLAHELLKPEGVFVGEVTIFTAIKGTTFDPEGKSNTSPEDIANLFWELHTKRDKTTVEVF
ncbi:hypothetical protein HDU96_001424 [Phlyctochytrium bullatum]|nr:hypothetical protein HDU96_001424 [Phlyctochytrium bullatum]